MSDAALISPQPIRWKDGGVDYVLAPADIDGELLFQSEHEGFALGRIYAVRDRAGEEAHREALAVYQQARDGNQFAFGGGLSLAYLWTPAGREAYFRLLMHKGHADLGGERPPPEGSLVRRIRDREDSVERLWAGVLARDFPRQWGAIQEAAALRAGATRSPSTADSSPSSPPAAG